MRIILQNQTDGLYLMEGDQWTEKKEEAKDFALVTEAERYCQEHELKAVALALRGNQTYQIHLDCQSKRARSKVRQE
jgi:hypothetical protein